MKGILLLLVFVFYNKLIYGGTENILSKFHQHEYKVREFRGEVVSYNKSAVHFFEIKTFKYNRTTPAVNVTINFKIDVKDKLEVLCQGYKLMSNEYRIFAIRFQTNLKKTIKANVAGISTGLLHCGNVTSEYAFYKDITYHFCNFTIDETHLPPLIPTGAYKMRLQYFYLDDVIGTANMYFEIYRPIYPANKNG